MEAFGLERSRVDDVARARVLAVDDHVPFLALLRDVIGSTGHLELVRADSPTTLVVLISTTHPDELVPQGGRASADAIVWKGRLGPRLLDEIWQGHRDPC